MEIHCNFTPSEKGYHCFVFKVKHLRRSDEFVMVCEHEAGFGDEDVNELTIWGVPLGRMPRRLIQLYPNLRQISILGCQITEVCHEDLAGLKKLVHLNLCHNRGITSLPDDLFEGLDSIREICFDSSITHMTSRIVRPFEHRLTDFKDEFINKTVGELLDEYVIEKNDVEKFKRLVDQKFKPPIGSSAPPQPPRQGLSDVEFRSLMAS